MGLPSIPSQPTFSPDGGALRVYRTDPVDVTESPLLQGPDKGPVDGEQIPTAPPGINTFPTTAQPGPTNSGGSLAEQGLPS